MPASSSSSQTGGRESATPGSQNSSSAGTNQTAAGTAGSRSPGQDAGAKSRAGNQQTGNGSRDTASGAANSRTTGGTSSVLGSPTGDYSLDTLPDGVLSGRNNTQATGGAMTTAERTAVLDEELQRGYETFDGFILSERERAETESNAAGSVAVGGEESGGGGGAAEQPQTMQQAGQPPSGAVVASMPTAQSAPAESFPPPGDIPSGRDDDVVARQLREAAMSEPDPELREALWEEYRKYTGISKEN